MLRLQLRLVPSFLRRLQGGCPVCQVLHDHLGTLCLARPTLSTDEDGLLLLIDHHSIECLRGITYA